MITVLFFASVREALGTARIEVPVGEHRCVADLVVHLAGSGDAAWREALGAEHLLVAVNQVMVTPDHPLAAGDEVAIFPPVTGG